ncbi:MAG TPA: hypothetical protein VEK15_21935 [Vicinamibacteria bacterium]|nr:hypothetical protein [Vicinamibacteria bacterium]
MFRARTLVILALVIAIVYGLTPPERKKRWKDKLRELGRALAVSIVIYWVYMLILYFFRQS